MPASQRPLTDFFGRAPASSKVASSNRNLKRKVSPQVLSSDDERPKKKSTKGKAKSVSKSGLATPPASSPATKPTASGSRHVEPSSKRKSMRPAKVQSTGFGSPTRTPRPTSNKAGSTSPPKDDEKEVIDLTNSPRQTYGRRSHVANIPGLPTPVTTSKNASWLSENTQFVFRASASHSDTSSLTTPAAPVITSQLPMPTPVTPTRRSRLSSKVATLADSSLTTLPSSPDTRQSDDRRSSSPLTPIKSCNIDPPTSPATIVPSSQTEMLDTVPLLFASPRNHAKFDDSQFKVPSIPLRLEANDSVSSRDKPSRISVESERDIEEEEFFVPSSQSQDMVAFFGHLLSSPHRSRSLSLDGRREIVPTSQLFESEVTSQTFGMSPRRDRFVRFDPKPADVDRKNSNRTQSSSSSSSSQVVPTSQYLTEKELSVSDVYALKLGLSRKDLYIDGQEPDGGSGLSHESAPSLANEASHIFKEPQDQASTSDYHAALPRTPTRRKRRSDSLASSQLKIDHIGDDPVRPLPTVLQPSHSTQDRHPSQERVELISQDCADAASSQTEPESPRWRVPTQRSDSSATEPESSQWRVKTQTSATEPESSQWRVPTQESMTQPESSQWRVPTQRTPQRKGLSRHSYLQAEDDDDLTPSQIAYSIPVASYDDTGGGLNIPSQTSQPIPHDHQPGDDPSPPADVSQREISPTFSEMEQTPVVDTQMEERLERAREAYHRARGIQHESSILSDAPLSIPSDYDGSYPTQSPSY